MSVKTKQLKPVKQQPSFFDQIEEEILKIFRREIYLPLLRELEPHTVVNSKDDLLKAIQDGKITFHRGKFTGKFNATLSKELKKLGAKWSEDGFKLALIDIPYDVKAAISTSVTAYSRLVTKLDSMLSKILPAKISEQIKLTDLFEKTLWKMNADIKDTMKGLTVQPKLTPEQNRKIAEGYTDNLDKYIQKFTDEQIQELRGKIKKNVLAGTRYEGIVGTIKSSYGVSERKAKFLARQETSLMLAKFKEVRYTSAGVVEYKWTNVAGSAAHPVRPMHKELNGTIQRWDKPPVTDTKGSRNNPGEDYNCRCYAIPLVKF